MMTIAFLDVGYRGDAARAACVLAQSWESEVPRASWVHDMQGVEPYQPGQFFRRELPGLLAVLRRLPALPDVAVVDGYVWLSAQGRPGLGAHLYQALGCCVPVIGIAKSAFKGAAAGALVAPVLRGHARRPLLVTSAGMELPAARQAVLQMAGEHRIPEMMKLADRLSRS